MGKIDYKISDLNAKVEDLRDKINDLDWNQGSNLDYIKSNQRRLEVSEKITERLLNNMFIVGESYEIKDKDDWVEGKLLEEVCLEHGYFSAKFHVDESRVVQITDIDFIIC